MNEVLNMLLTAGSTH